MGTLLQWEKSGELKGLLHYLPRGQKCKKGALGGLGGVFTKMVIYIHREVKSDLLWCLFCFFLQDLSTLDQKPCVVLHESFHFLWSMPFWNWLKYETLWNKIAAWGEVTRFIFWQLNIFCNVNFSIVPLQSMLSLKYKSFNSSTCLLLWGINFFCTVTRLEYGHFWDYRRFEFFGKGAWWSWIFSVDYFPSKLHFWLVRFSTKIQIIV